MQTKIIKFDYYTVKRVDLQGESAVPKDVDLTGVLNSIYVKDFADKVKQIGNSGVVLLQCQVDKSRMVVLQFAKIRDAILPSIINDLGKCHELILKKQENIAEFTSVLYDVQHGIFMIQKSQDGASLGQIWAYLDAFMGSEKLLFSAIISPEKLSRFVGGTVVKKLEVTVASSTEFEDPSMHNLAAVAKNTGTKFITLGLSMGRAKKSEGLKLSRVLDIAKLFMPKPETKKIKIAARIPGRDVTEVFNLLEDRIHSEKKFTYDRYNRITSERIQEEMKVIYAEKCAEVLECIKG